MGRETMSMLESDLKSRIEEEIREIVSRRTSELLEDKLAQTAESPGLSAPPVRAIAPTLLDEGEISAVPSLVRSVPPVAASPAPVLCPRRRTTRHRRPRTRACRHSFTGPPPPMSMMSSSNYPPSIPPQSMVPSMIPSSRGDQWSGSCVVWPEVQDPSAPRRDRSSQAASDERVSDRRRAPFRRAFGRRVLQDASSRSRHARSDHRGRRASAGRARADDGRQLRPSDDDGSGADVDGPRGGRRERAALVASLQG